MLLWARIMEELEAHLQLAHEISRANAATDDDVTNTPPACDADPAETTAEPAEEAGSEEEYDTDPFVNATAARKGKAPMHQEPAQALIEIKNNGITVATLNEPEDLRTLSSGLRRHDGWPDYIPNPWFLQAIKITVCYRGEEKRLECPVYENLRNLADWCDKLCPNDAKETIVDDLFEWLDLISSTRLPGRLDDPEEPEYSNGEPREDQLVKELADLPEFVVRTDDDRQIHEEFVRADDPSTLPGFNPQMSTLRRTRSTNARKFFFDDLVHPSRCANDRQPAYLLFR